MKTFTIIQKILSFGATYKVLPEGSEAMCYIIKGKVFTMAAKLEMRQSDDGEVLKTMKGNFFNTQFTIIDKSGSDDAFIRFPFLSLRAKFSLTIGTDTYNAQGGFSARKFSCEDEAGNVKFTIFKELAFRDKFVVSIDESIPEEIALLTAVAVDQRFFQQRN